MESLKFAVMENIEVSLLLKELQAAEQEEIVELPAALIYIG